MTTTDTDKVFRILISDTRIFYYDIIAASAHEADSLAHLLLQSGSVDPIEDGFGGNGYQVESTDEFTGTYDEQDGSALTREDIALETGMEISQSNA